MNALLEGWKPLVKATVGFFMLTVATSLHWPFYPGIAPFLSFAMLHFYGVHAPEELPLFIVMLVGLIKDCYVGDQVGFHALMMVFFYTLVVIQRRFLIKKPFSMLWCHYIVFLSLVFVLYALVYPAPLVTRGIARNGFDLVVSFLCYPLILKLSERLRLGRLAQHRGDA